MKKIILAVFCLIMMIGSGFSQTDKKVNYFNDLKTLRFQYRSADFSINSMQSFGEAGKFDNQRTELAQMKIKIADLDREYIKLLSKDELIQYNKWKMAEDLKDKSPDMNWWYVYSKNNNGC